MPDKELDLQWTKEQEEYVNTLKEKIDLYKSLEKQIDETETNSNVESKKEITKIKSHGFSLTVLEKLLKVKEENEQLKSKIIELNEQIEKMKCCGNCSKPCWDPPIVRKSECLCNNYSLWRLRI